LLLDVEVDVDGLIERMASYEIVVLNEFDYHHLLLHYSFYGSYSLIDVYSDVYSDSW